MTDWYLLPSGPPEYLHKADVRQVVERISWIYLGRGEYDLQNPFLTLLTVGLVSRS